VTKAILFVVILVHPFFRRLPIMPSEDWLALPFQGFLVYARLWHRHNADGFTGDQVGAF
jgi:hypothetical protein